MKIVIVGDGKVGSALTEYLSREGHDIVIIDNHPRVIEDALNSYDVMGITGNGASINVQMEAGVNKANLLIAATSSDELNILCCLVGKKIGARHTIARVRNPDYFHQLSFMRDQLGISMMVNPEFEAANEIARMLRTPSAITIESFAKGMIDLAQIKIMPDSPLEDLPLSQISRKWNRKILVCAVQRDDGQVFIPGGDFILRAGDKVHITASHAALNEFFKDLHIFRHRIKNVMLVGGGKIAYYLAKNLLDMNMRVTIIEQNEERCIELSGALPKAMIIQGDGSNQHLLEEEGVADMDAFVSLTGIDEENIILSLYAKSQQVHKVITKINKITFGGMTESLGLESIISPKNLTANHIVSYVRARQNSRGSNVKTLYKIVDGQAEALEFAVTDKTPFLGIPLKTLNLKPNILVACIARKGRLIIAGGDDAFELGDTVILITMNQCLDDLNDIIEVG